MGVLWGWGQPSCCTALVPARADMGVSQESAPTLTVAGCSPLRREVRGHFLGPHTVHGPEQSGQPNLLFDVEIQGASPPPVMVPPLPSL